MVMVVSYQRSGHNLRLFTLTVEGEVRPSILSAVSPSCKVEVRHGSLVD